MSVTTYDLGTVLMVPKGDWSASVSYERLNLVRHNGTAWLCTVAAGSTSLNEEPSLNATNWEILVSDQSSVTSINGLRGDVDLASLDETISGDKTFTGQVDLGANATATTPDEDDESTKVATTEWVKNTTLTNAVGGYNLFDVKWSDHRLNDMSWLRSDTFSWHNGDVYSAAYEELLAEYTDNTSETITIGNITCKRTPKKYLIADATQVNAIQQLFEETGVAWYYILDSTNKRFKLPRTKFGFTGLRGGVGDFVEAGLPNITGEVDATYATIARTSATGVFTDSNSFDGTSLSSPTYNTTANMGHLRFKASNSNPIYGNSSTVQPPATEMYLYHYVGNFNRQAVLAAIGITGDSLEDITVANNPVGTIIWSMASTVPSGYLLCNGQAVGRLAYPELFTAIGTTYGDGDGDSTFNLPNLIGKFVEGNATAGIEHEAGLPNITGSIAPVTDSLGALPLVNAAYGSDALYADGVTGMPPSLRAGETGNGPYNFRISLDASKSNPIYGNSDTVQPPSLTAMPCIKAFDAVVNDGTVDISELVNEAPMRMYNTREILTTSGTWTAPVTGWYRIHLIGGGGAGMTEATWSNVGSSFGGGGGGAGGEKTIYKYLQANQSISYVIGAGGAGAVRYIIGGNGGTTSITISNTTYSVSGGKAAGTASGLNPGDNTGSNQQYGYISTIGGEGGWDGSDPLTRGQAGGSGTRYGSTSSTPTAGAGGGRGGGLPNNYGGSPVPDSVMDATGFGGGGGGNVSSDNTKKAGSGYQGCIVIEYFNPATSTN